MQHDRQFPGDLMDLMRPNLEKALKEVVAEEEAILEARDLVYVSSSLTDIKPDPEEVLRYLSSGFGNAVMSLIKESSSLGPKWLAVELVGKVDSLFLESWELAQKHKVERRKVYYSRVATVLREIFGPDKVFLPQEHYDPVANTAALPADVRATEARIVQVRTKLMVVLVDDPANGLGIELGWTEDRGIPVILQRSREVALSRLARGLTNVIADQVADSEDEAIVQIKVAARRYLATA